MKKCTICHSEKELSEFNKKKKNKDGLQNVCRECNKLRCKQYYANNQAKHRSVVATRNRTKRVELRTKLNTIKSINPCPCGEADPICLEFHHICKKDLEIGLVSRYRWGWTKIESELQKCVVLCSNCHKKKHAGKVIKMRAIRFKEE